MIVQARLQLFGISHLASKSRAFDTHIMQERLYRMLSLLVVYNEHKPVRDMF